MDSISSRSAGCLAGRRLSHSLASTSGRDVARRRGRSRLQVSHFKHAALLLHHPVPICPAFIVLNSVVLCNRWMLLCLSHLLFSHPSCQCSTSQVLL
jgi:hypothetical protein